MSEVINRCEICFKNFKYNYLLERHKKSKRKCKPVHIDDLVEATNKLEQLADKIIDKESTENNNDYDDDDEIYHIKCKYCNKVFTRKSGLNNHLGLGSKSSKVLCKMKNDNVNIYERELGIKPKLVDLKCRFCKKMYTKQSSFSRHQNAGCKAKERYEEELEQRVLKLRNKAAQNIQNQTINNTTNNTININLPPMRAFGDENLDYITTKYLLQELNKCLNMNDMTKVVGNFTRMIHANPAHPENHNVQIRSLNGGYARVFNGKSFEDRQALDVQDEILQRVGSLITNKCDEYQEQPDYTQTHRINDRSLERVRSTISDDIIDQIDYTGAGGLTNRTLTNYRTKVKSTLHSNKGKIQSTQRLLDNTVDIEEYENDDSVQLIES